MVDLKATGNSCTTHLFLVALLLSRPVVTSPAEQNAVHESLQRAAQLLSEEQFQAARVVLEELVNSTGQASPPQAYYQLALCYVKQSEWKRAEQVLEKFLQISPESFPGGYLKGFIQFSTGRYEESLRLMLTLAEKNPEHAATHKVVGHDQFMLGKSDLAEAELKHSVELAPRDAEAHYYLGRIHFMRDNLTAALADFQRATELDPSSVKAHNHLGQTCEALVQYPAARSAYLKAIEFEKRQTVKSEWPYFNLGSLCLRQGQAPEAEAFLRQALEPPPRWSEGKAKLGMALLAQGRLSEALSCLEQAVQIDPKNADARYQYARLLVKLGKQDEAERHLELFQQQKKP